MTTTTTNGVAHRILHERHRQELYGSGLTDETIEQSGIYTETDHGTLARYANYKSWSTNYGPALVFPFYDEHGEIVTRRLKSSSPPKRDGKSRKYLTPKGEPNHAYIPREAWRAINDLGDRLIITEGEKKALSATQHGFACIGATGVDAWHRKQSFEMLPELERIDWSNREVYVAFDSDVVDNPNVLRAERQLAAALQSRGAQLKIVRLSASGDDKVGLDDFLVANGPGAFEQLIDQAEDPDPPEAGEQKQNAKYCDPAIEADHILKASVQSGAVTLCYWRGSWCDGAEVAGGSLVAKKHAAWSSIR